MILIELSKPAAEPVSLAEAKEWARIERDDEDALIGTLIAAARESIEQRTILVLGDRDFRLSLDRAPVSVKAGRRPLTAVTRVTAYDRDGAPLERDAGEASIRGEDTLNLSPALRQAAPGGLEIELRAGIAAENVPDAVRVALLRIVAASYETRGLVGLEMQPAIVPPLAATLLAPFRRVAL